jgi:ATP-dependent Clp protease protease subunit
MNMRCEEEESKDSKQTSEVITSRLLKTRTVLITGEIDHDLAERIISQLLVLDAESHQPIRMILTTNGGHIESGFAVYDIMRFIESDIIAVSAGWVVSMGVPILFGAKKENRLSLPNTRFMIHQPMGGVGGPATDVRIAAQEIIKIRERINQLIAEETGQSLGKVNADCDRNFWLTAPEAKDYGIISRIIQSVREI